MNISTFQSIYLDTSVYIYFFEGAEKFGDQAEHILTQVVEQQLPVFCSELLFTELLVLPMKENNKELTDIYLGLEGYIPTLKTIPVDRSIAVEAAKLRVKYGLRTPDAIHLATAIFCKVGCFVSSDKSFRKVKEIEVQLF